jgi:hypothetical protein
MLEICAGTYLLLGVVISLLLWSALFAGKRADEAEHRLGLRARRPHLRRTFLPPGSS